MSSGRLGILGGTFDPIHAGHLAAARAAQAALHLDEVRLVPSRMPPHRPEAPAVSAFHRFAMVALAVQTENRWRADDLEVTREGPSYTIDTLNLLHEQGVAASQIFFIIGSDAFAEISTWHRFPAVLDAAHFVVVQRSGGRLDDLASRIPELSGRVGRAGPEVPVFASTLLLEADTPAVSSTEIRRRARAGTSLDGLVAPTVARYIETQQLYRDPLRILESRLHGEN